ncbi:MAG TPA: J domain-containing protein [Armatimonadaceae bacterium]|nr:J domain-containing protein [Armatimonadaceae bacterium]
MSIPRRIVRISKAYLDQVKGRIDAELTERERSLADSELTALPGDDLEARGRAAAPARASDEAYDNSPDALMRRAEERIAAARHAAESAAELSRALDQASARESAAAARNPDAQAATRGGGSSSAAVESSDPNASDYRILGVPIASDLATVQAAYEKLARRCDPRRFPDGSTEQKEAERILVRVNAAYDALRRRLDPTENRFGKLELE